MAHYYGQYQSSTLSQTGCVKQFCVVSQKMDFPPRVEYLCDLCDTTHSFRFLKTVGVHSNKQQIRWEGYCSEQGIELDVQIT